MFSPKLYSWVSQTAFTYLCPRAQPHMPLTCPWSWQTEAILISHSAFWVSHHLPSAPAQILLVLPGSHLPSIITPSCVFCVWNAAQVQSTLLTCQRPWVWYQYPKIEQWNPVLCPPNMYLQPFFLPQGGFGWWEDSQLLSHRKTKYRWLRAMGDEVCMGIDL